MKNSLCIFLALAALIYLGESGLAAQVYIPPENELAPPLEENAFPLPYPYWNYYPNYDEFNSPSYNQRKSDPEQAAFPYHPV